MGKNPYASLSQPNIISPSSSFKPKLSDQASMELVCENGQIFAKSRRPNNNSYFQNQRTQSILDLYETEYDEGFKKNIKNLGGSQVVPVSESQRPQQDEDKKRKINPSKTESERDVWKRNKRFESSKLMNDSLKSLKNVEVTTAPPDEQSIAVGRSAELYFASSSMLSGGTSRDLSCCSLKKRKYGDMEEEESTYLSNSDDGSDDGKTRVTTTTRKTVAKKKRSTEVHKLSERKRRNEISKKMCELQDLLPNCYKDDKVSLLDEAIKYMRTLQLQVQMMSMGNGIIPSTSTMLAMGHYSPMGLGMHMGAAATTTSVPQFLPMNLQGTGFPRINEASSQMLSNFLNHPTGLIPNCPIFSPLESCSHQFVVPSCFPGTHSTSFTPFSKSAPTSNLEDAMQFKGSNGY
uniref:BHLH domain-containing protein n=1 Tax=Brassica campestris TaxID=3711 RepID=A0A679KAH4_BRACM|nr:Unknown [Brassica rapa]CAA8287729.1 Unknown [Brassica rapa]CAA8392346.1 Unknown [Brassica rapa]CAA8404007.1 Unknown [Brassica rapa]